MSDRPNADPRPWLVIAAFATIYLVWGSTYLAIRFALEGFPPFLMAGGRFVIAGSILFALVRRRGDVRITARNWFWCAVTGTLLLVGGNGLVCWAEQHVASGLVALLVATMPAWILILSWLLFRGPRPTGWMLLGIVVGLAGVVVLIGPSNIGGAQIYWLGALVALCAPIFWSLGSLLSRSADLPKSSLLSTAMQMLSGSAASFLVGTLSGEWSRVSWDAVSVKAVFSVAYLVVFGSVLALSAYNWLLRVCPPSKVTTYAYVNPVIAVLLGALLAGEPLTPRVIIATILIVASVIIIIRFKEEQTIRYDGEEAPDASAAAPPAGIAGDAIEPVRDSTEVRSPCATC